MSLLKTRPGLRLGLPSAATLGRPVEGVLVMNVTERLPVDRIKVTLRGRTSSMDGNTFPSTHEETIRLGGARVLEPGLHRLPFAIPLSDATAPTYHSPRESRVFTVRALVEIPWWTDAAVEQTLLVLPAFAERVTAESRTTTTSPQDSSTPALTIEVMLDADAARPGDLVTGQVALSTSDLASPGLRLGLRECLGDPFDDHFHTLEVHRIEGVLIEFDELRQGQPVDFEFEVPASFAYSFRAPDRRRFHEVFARFDGGFLANLMPFEAFCPVRIFPARVQIARPALTRQPLGATRRQQQLLAVAAALGATARGGQLVREFGSLRVQVSPRVGDAWRRLVVEITYPDLGLGLSMRPATFIAGAVTATSREPPQIDGLRRDLEPWLETFSSFQVDDTSLTAGTANDDSLDALKSFAVRAFALAETLPRLFAALPPPTALVDQVALFEQIARAISGDLRRSGMIVEGTVDDLPARLRPRWDGGALRGFTARLTPGSPLAAALHTTDPGSPALPEEARQLLARLVSDGDLIAISERGVEFSTGPSLASAAVAVGWLNALAEVVRALSPRHSPYR